MAKESTHTNVESIAPLVVSRWKFGLAFAIYSPFIFNGLDDEPKCWIDRVDILIHQFLDDCGFAGIIQTAEMASAKWLDINVGPQTASIFSSLCPSIELCAILKASSFLTLFQWT